MSRPTSGTEISACDGSRTCAVIDEHAIIRLAKHGCSAYG